MNIAVITNNIDSPYNHRIINGLLKNTKSLKIVLCVKNMTPDFLRLRRQMIAYGINFIINKIKAKINGMGGYDFGGLEINEPVKELLKRHKVPIKYVSGLNSRSCLKYLNKFNVNFLVNGGAGIFEKRIIGHRGIKIINGHMGLLPKYRGVHVLEWAYLQNDEIGATIHLIDSGIDTGDVLVSKKFTPKGCISVQQLRAFGFNYVADLLVEYLCSIKNNEITPIKQVRGDEATWYVMHPRLNSILEKKLLAEIRCAE